MSGREQAGADLQDTGERMIPDLEKNDLNRLVHEYRYDFALRFLGSHDHVLDFGCGSGYGASMLAAHTTGECLGIDMPGPVAYARQRYPASNIEFIAGDLCDPGCRHGHFNLIVSFDVIEHVNDIDSYLENIASQLDPSSGVALISTPWSSRRDNRRPLHNEFHVEELSLDDFMLRLSGHFEIEDIMLTIGALAVVRPKGSDVKTPGINVLHVPLDLFLALERDYERVCQALELSEPMLAALGAQTDAMSVEVNRANSTIPPERHVARGGTAVLDRLDAEQVVFAEFTAHEDCLAGIRLLPGTYQRLCSGQIFVRVEEHPAIRSEIDGLGEPAVRGSSTFGLVARDGEPLEFRFSPIALSRGRHFKVEVRALGMRPDEAIGIWRNPDGQALMQPIYRRLRWRGESQHLQDTEWLVLQDEFRAPEPSPGIGGRGNHTTLPPAQLRPWSSEASISTKIAQSIRVYGVIATIREMYRWAKWRLSRF